MRGCSTTDFIVGSPELTPHVALSPVKKHGAQAGLRETIPEMWVGDSATYRPRLKESGRRDRLSGLLGAVWEGWGVAVVECELFRSEVKEG